jgi:glycosyltransferase involved in cell wall biosynthesis
MATVLVSMEKLKSPHLGMGQFALHLGRALLKIDDPSIRPVFLLPGSCRRQFRGMNARFARLSPLRKEVVCRMVRPLARLAPAACRRFDLWHATNQEAKYLPMDRRIPLILTIHDLNFLRERSPLEFRSRLRVLQKKIDRATAVTTISEFSASEIRRQLDLGDKKLHVIHNGVPEVGHPAPARPRGIPDGPFLLALGRVAPKKNLHVLVDLMERLPGYTLVIAGDRRGRYGNWIEWHAGRLGIADRIVLTGVVGDAQRCWLYDHADALLFPSLTEGFGLPVVEAMSQGKPVFLSDCTSLPEVAGAEGFYWRDYDPDHMAQVFHQGMVTFRTDPEFPGRLHARAARFTWKRAAAAYHGLYREVLNGRKPGTAPI